MVARSNIRRLAPEAREYIEQLLREDTLTLDEMLDAIRMQFPSVDVSRSGLHRYRSAFDQMGARMKEIERVAEALIGGLGEGASDKGARLLAHAVTTAVTHAALQAQENDDTSMQELKDLSLAAGRAIKAQRLATDEALTIEKAAIARMQREQSAKLDEVASAQGMDEAQVKFWREAVLGIR
jgi:hypothetical protein